MTDLFPAMAGRNLLACLALWGQVRGTSAQQPAPVKVCPVTAATFPCDLVGTGSGTFNGFNINVEVTTRRISLIVPLGGTSSLVAGECNPCAQQLCSRARCGTGAVAPPSRAPLLLADLSPPCPQPLHPPTPAGVVCPTKVEVVEAGKVWLITVDISSDLPGLTFGNACSRVQLTKSANGVVAFDLTAHLDSSDPIPPSVCPKDRQDGAMVSTTEFKVTGCTASGVREVAAWGAATLAACGAATAVSTMGLTWL